MSKILRRPMFRGGRVSSYGNGIATGLANGGRVNLEVGGLPRSGREVLDIKEEFSKIVPQQKGLSTGDYLRIASAGMDILGAPSEGGGIKGLLASAAKPLSRLGTDLGSSMDQRAANRQKEITDLTSDQAQYNLGMAQIDKKTATEINLGVVDAFYNDKISFEEAKVGGGNSEIINNFNRIRDEAKLDIAQGGNKASKFRILSPANMELAIDLARQELGEDASLEKIRTSAIQTLLGMVQSFDKGLSGLDVTVKEVVPTAKAEGGIINETTDVNMMTETPMGMTDVNVEETKTAPTETNEINISYDQLRDRLPPEITDDIVLLISQSYEALADFSEIQTQADVNQFNTKYDVQLFLPQQTGV